MAKLILLLLIAGSLALFAASNLTPISLVILGIRTQALPLALWVLGALLAGAATTVLLSGFSSLSKGAAVRRANQPARDSRSPWTAARSDPKPESTSSAAGFTAAGSGRTSRPADRPAERPAERPADRPADRREAKAEDDWERDPEAWDNWNEPAPGSRTPKTDGARAESRTRTNDSRAGWDEYENRVRSSNRRDPAAPATNSRPDQRPDQRTDSRTSSGRSQPETRKGDGYKGDVYDAEYRVLIPPYSTPANPTPPPPAPTPAPSDEEDWGLDDELQDRPR